MRILLVEDETALVDALRYLLEKEGYLVDVAYDGLDGEAYACSGIYDVIILDRMLPGKEGVEILHSIRAKKLSSPVMFLTAKDSIANRVEGLEAGADDYLIKPFANKEFLARVKALSRRSESYNETNLYTVAGTTLDMNHFTYEINHKCISLSKTEAQLLELLLRNKNQVLTKEQILDRIWGYDSEIEITNVELYIFYLRKKINFADANLELKTIRGVGYSLLSQQ